MANQPATRRHRRHVRPRLGTTAPETLGRGDPRPPCTRCADRPDPPYCLDCYGTRQVRRGAVLTVTDLRGRTVHRNW
ncbi:hypothetical protein, partial [Micromonospora sp. LOL_015]|uniref:hypothetical protein n=1 Tax=Micromonospora sp. LOL_015 TaxID=3345416 RepID=UPI003A8A40FC